MGAGDKVLCLLYAGESSRTLAISLESALHRMEGVEGVDCAESWPPPQREDPLVSPQAVASPCLASLLVTGVIVGSVKWAAIQNIVPVFPVGPCLGMQGSDVGEGERFRRIVLLPRVRRGQQERREKGGGRQLLWVDTTRRWGRDIGKASGWGESVRAKIKMPLTHKDCSWSMNVSKYSFALHRVSERQTRTKYKHKYLSGDHPKAGGGGKEQPQCLRPWEAKKRRGMGNMSNRTLGRRLGRQSHVKRSIAIIFIDRSPTAAGDDPGMLINRIRNGKFYNGTHALPSDLRNPGGFSLLTIAFSFSSLIFWLPISTAVIPGMGQHTWATPEQLAYLESFVNLCPQAKGTTGLKTLYQQVYDGFLAKWDAEPVDPEPDTSLSAEELEAKSNARLKRVSALPSLPRPHAHSLPAHHPLVQKYAERRKRK